MKYLEVDHLPTFVMMNLTSSRRKKRDDMFFKRDPKRFNQELLLEDLKQEFSTFKVKESFSINGQFDDFTDRLAKIVNTHAPLRHATREEKRLRKKPWLSRGIGLLKFVAHKNKMLVVLRKNFDDSLVKRYKTYRNVLNRTVQTAKKIYYHNQLSANKKNPRKIWQIIDELASLKKRKKFAPTESVSDGKTITDLAQISETCNDFFASIGKTLAKQIPPESTDSVSKCKGNNEKSNS